MNKFGALRLSALLVVMIFGISTVGFGLLLANTHAATPVASGAAVNGQTGTAEGKSCRVLSRTTASLSGSIFEMAGLDAIRNGGGG